LRAKRGNLIKKKYDYSIFLVRLPDFAGDDIEQKLAKKEGDVPLGTLLLWINQKSSFLIAFFL